VVSLIIAIGAITGCLAASNIGGMFGRRPVYFGMCLFVVPFGQLSISIPDGV